MIDDDKGYGHYCLICHGLISWPGGVYGYGGNICGCRVKVIQKIIFDEKYIESEIEKIIKSREKETK